MSARILQMLVFASVLFLSCALMDHEGSHNEVQTFKDDSVFSPEDETSSHGLQEYAKADMDDLLVQEPFESPWNPSGQAALKDRIMVARVQNEAAHLKGDNLADTTNPASGTSMLGALSLGHYEADMVEESEPPLEEKDLAGNAVLSAAYMGHHEQKEFSLLQTKFNKNWYKNSVLSKALRGAVKAVGTKAKAWIGHISHVAKSSPKAKARKQEMKRIKQRIKKMKKPHKTTLERNCLSLKSYAMAATDQVMDVSAMNLPVLKKLLLRLAKPWKKGGNCVSQFKSIMKGLKEDPDIQLKDSISQHILRMVDVNMRKKGLLAWKTLKDATVQCVGHQIHCKKEVKKYRERYYGQWCYLEGVRVGLKTQAPVLAKLAVRISEIFAAASKIKAHEAVRHMADANAINHFSKEETRIMFSNTCHGPTSKCAKYYTSKMQCVHHGCWFTGPWSGNEW